MKFLDDTNFEELYCHPLDPFEVSAKRAINTITLLNSYHYYILYIYSISPPISITSHAQVHAPSVLAPFMTFRAKARTLELELMVCRHRVSRLSSVRKLSLQTLVLQTGFPFHGMTL